MMDHEPKASVNHDGSQESGYPSARSIEERSKEGYDEEQANRNVSSGDGSIVYVHGRQFWSITSVILMLMFLTYLEIPIIVTAAVAITDDLGGLEMVGWIVASYLLGYIGVIVIFAKFSDILGRKFMLLVSSGLFIIFSAACSASQSIIQVIVFRAFQGVGGGGCFSICTTIMMEIVPPEKYTQYVSYINITSALALLAGPIIGGAIAANTSWRWIFIINVPIASIAFVLAVISIPVGFPYHDRPDHGQPRKVKDFFHKAVINRVDLPGTLLILLATLGLTAGFEEAGSLFPWRSAYVISLLTVSGLLFIALAVWERHVTVSATVREPVLPTRLFNNQWMISIFLNQFLIGGPCLIGMFLLPQRFQLVYGLSGLDAGIRFIPFSFAIPVATIFSAVLAGKKNIPLVYIFLSGACLQVVGFALLGTLPITPGIPARIYGYELIAGWGCGMNFSLLTIAIPLVVESRDRAVGLGAGAQFRFMGSAIVLSISTSVLNNYLRPQLDTILGIADADLSSLGGSFSMPSEAVAEQVRQVVAEGYNRQTLVLCVVAALQVPATLLLWSRNKKLVA